jgi:hypothetical protein
MGEPHVLEEGQRLSRSRLWRLLRSAYSSRSDGFSSGIVPHYGTCNAWIAEAYARVLEGWLRDHASADPSEPLYLVELGCGSGRFAFMVLQALRLRKTSAPRFTWVLTDFTDAQVEALRRHPQLQDFVAAGQLDFARFDAGRDVSLTLLHAQRTIEHTKNPLAVVANYFFDTIPQDVFYVCDGRLEECLVKLTLPAAPHDPEDPAILRRLTVGWSDAPATPYGDPALDGILERYRQRLRRSAVKFPVVALECLGRLRAIAADRLLLLTSDKGLVLEAELDGKERPGIALHGTVFSMSVNYHAIGEWFRDAGGQVLAMEHHSPSLNTAGFVLGPAPETARAFVEHVARFSPDDFFSVRRALEKRLESLSLEEALGILRLGRGDPRMLLRLQPRLRKLAREASALQLRQLMQLIERAEALYFHIGEDHDFSFDVGVLLVDMGRCEAALERFLVSRQRYGDDPTTAYNLALCCQRLGRLDEAHRRIDEVLAQKPDYEAAVRLKKDIRIELDSQKSQ